MVTKEKYADLVTKVCKKAGVSVPESWEVPVDFEKTFSEICEGLSTREEVILKWRESLDEESPRRLTLEECGEKLLLTRERVRQIENKIWKKLVHPVRIKIFLEGIGKYTDAIQNKKQSAAEAQEPLHHNAVSVDVLDLSNRTSNALKFAHITNIGQLEKMSFEEVLLLRRLGNKSAEELKDKMEENGYKLRASTVVEKSSVLGCHCCRLRKVCDKCDGLDSDSPCMLEVGKNGRPIKPVIIKN